MCRHRKLNRSFKGKFPFTLAATSFIYPASWAENVEMLAPFVDEIELLLFESGYPGSLPDNRQIDRMRSLSQAHGLTFNVHLPLDISLGDIDPKKREHAVNTVIRALNLTAPLSPTTCTLHWTFEEEKKSSGQIENQIQKWRGRLAQSMEQILSEGFSPNLFSVENIDYPFDWALPLIQDLNLRVCLDIGHFEGRGESFLDTFLRLENRIDILHIYAAAPERDHSGLERLDGKKRRDLWQILQNWKGTVSVEVFSLADLESSLEILRVDWKNFS